MLAFCTSCWAEIADKDSVCQECGFHIQSDSRSYREKLRNALHHPLPEARARVCWVIGRLQAADFVPELEQALADTDQFVRLAAVNALQTFGDQLESTRELLKHLVRSDTLLVREAARQALSKKASET